MGFQLLRGLFKNWGHHLAGAAPRCPEIDQHRDVAVFYDAVKVAAGQLNWAVVKQRCAAFAASAFATEFAGGHAIGSQADGAGYV